MTLEEYEETFWPTPVCLCLENLKVGEKFYFDDPTYTRDRPFEVYEINEKGVCVGEVNRRLNHGEHPFDIRVKRA